MYEIGFSYDVLNIPQTKFHIMIKIFFLVLLVLVLPLAGCVPTQQSGLPDTFKGISIPTKWAKHSAVILHHSTALTFEVRDEGNIVKRKDVRWFQVNTRSEEGVEHIAFNWSKTFEKPLNIEVQAYYPDGRKWNLAKKDIESDKDPNGNRVTESFRIPGYDQGVVIRIVTEREYFQPEFYGTFRLASSYPVLERTISLKLPEDNGVLYGVSAEGKNAIQAETIRSDGYEVFTVSAYNLDSTDEKWTTHFPEDYYAALNVSFPPKGKKSYTWKELGDHYLDLSKSAFEITDSIRNVADELNITDEVNTVATVFKEVVQRIRYHGDWNGRFAFFPRDAKVVLENGYGDCKELAAILKSLLRTQDVESNFVLLSTWNNFQAIEDYPNLDNFNHAILAVPSGDDSYQYLDATHSWADSTTSYYASIGRKAFVIKDGESHLTTIRARSGFDNTVTTYTQILPAANSSKWVAEGTVDLTGYTALRFYEKFHYTDETDDSSFMRSFLRRYLDIVATTVEHEKLTPNHVTLKYSGSFYKQYIPVGQGGFKLGTPMVHKSYINDRFTDLDGKTHQMPLTQIDRWKLPFKPSQQQLDGFTSSIGRGSWKIDGAMVLRKYRQNEIVIEDTDIDYEVWYSKINTFINSSVWR